MTAKKQALDVIKRLPAKASFEEIACEIKFLAAIDEAEEAIERGQVLSLEEVRKMIPRWISESSQRRTAKKGVAKRPNI